MKKLYATLLALLLLILNISFAKAAGVEEEMCTQNKFDVNIQTIVDIINNRGDADYESTKETWKDNLAYLNKNYSLFSDSEKAVIDWYIMEFSWAARLNEFPAIPYNTMVENKEVFTKSSKTDDAQDRSGEPYFATLGEKATYYASVYYNSPNPAYPYYVGADCANFVSQCLHYADKPMAGSAVSGGPNGINSWYCYTNSNTDYTNTSESWRAANGFCNYWYTHALSKGFYSPSSAANYGAAYQAAKIGDAISLCYGSSGNVWAHHTMIVVGKLNGQLLLAAHTNPTINSTLLSKVTANGYTGFYIFNILAN